MGVRFPSVSSTTLLTSTVITVNETALITTPPINVPLDFALVMIVAFLVITPGTGSTNARALIHRGSGIGGQLVNMTVPHVTVTAGNPDTLNICYTDTPGAVAELPYTLSVLVAGATANSTIGDAALIVFVL